MEIQEMFVQVLNPDNEGTIFLKRIFEILSYETLSWNPLYD